jgi:NADPH-dependent curcumin reductase CurA
MSAKNINRQWLLARRPVGTLKPEDSKYSESPIPTPAEREVLVRALYFGYDASQRIYIHEGFEKVPALLPIMFTGKNPGKMVPKIGDPRE